MAVKLQHHIFIPSSSKQTLVSRNSNGNRVNCERAAHLDYLLSNWDNSRKKCIMKVALLGNCSGKLHCQSRVCRKPYLLRRFVTLASADDGVAVNGSPQSSSSSDDVANTRVKLSQSLQGEDYGERLVQLLHDCARVFELAIREHSLRFKVSWFSTAWLGIDRNAWVKTLAYQASVYALLQAACQIASRVDGRDRDTNVFVQRSLLRLSAPLESIMREKLSAKQSETNEWFWSEQIPAAVTSFANNFERDPRFTTVTSALGKDITFNSSKGSDISLLLLALTCIAATTKLGASKISCNQFFSMNSEITGSLMDMLIDIIPMRQACHSVKEIGLWREFLIHFGPRAATCRVNNDSGSEEVVFWVNLVQKQLQRAIDRERIWSKLTTSESIEVLEKDLAIFGFFVALGRSTQTFLVANGFDVIDGPIEDFIRYLIGGSVVYYPQLSSISSYQLYVEVVCEELDWLPFYPGINAAPKQSHGHKPKRVGPPNAEAIPQALEVCSHWMQSFIKHSKWLENPSNVKAARFLSKGLNKLTECMEHLGLTSARKITESNNSANGRAGYIISSANEKEMDSFDKALESVEEAMIRLEKLLKELHVSSSNSGKEQLRAACSDLEKIRKLKKEAEFLEASFRAKAAAIRQGNDEGNSESIQQQQHSKWSRDNGKFQGLWDFIVPSRKKKADILEGSGNSFSGQNSSVTNESESNEIRRYELLRNELMELERRVQRSTNPSEIEEDNKVTDESSFCNDNAGNAQLVQVQKKETLIGKSLDKLKETTTDVLQGTQLLAIDVAASTELLRRLVIGDELTEKEKKVLRRTMTDLASVVPIGVLMLLPVTAVGHAAMLAAIQRYVPALIPSTYGSERLDLLRQLEKVKEMDVSETDSEANEEEIA